MTKSNSYKKYFVFFTSLRIEIYEAISKGGKKDERRYNVDTTKKLLAENTDINFIARVTNLTVEEIEKIKNKEIKNN